MTEQERKSDLSLSRSLAYNNLLFLNREQVTLRNWEVMTLEIFYEEAYSACVCGKLKASRDGS